MYDSQENKHSYWNYQKINNSNSASLSNNLYKEKEDNKYDMYFNLLPYELTKEEKNSLKLYFDAAYFAKENPVQFLYNVANNRDLTSTDNKVLYGG